jgi:hypothetical protein
LCAIPAFGQSSKGEFTLPHEVHWGTIVLPAGSYSYSVERHAGPVLVVYPKTGGEGYFLMASAVSRTDATTPNRLTIEHRGADWYVTRMGVNDMGEALLFQAPAVGSASDSKPKLATIASK